MGNDKEMSAAKQSLKDKLYAIILLETSKPYKEMDSDLVTECVDFLMELEGKERLSQEEIEQRVNEIPFKGKVTVLGAHAKKKLRAKRLAVIAAVLAVLIALFGVISIASENTFGDLLSRMGHELMELLDNNDSIEYEGITIYKADEVRTYSTLEELLEAEALDVLYPTWLPDDEKITQVMYLLEDETERYSLQCGNPRHGVSIYINRTITENMTKDCLSKEINGFTVYYFLESSLAQGNFAYKNNVYSIGADTEENLFKIIENLEEIK